MRLPITLETLYAHTFMESALPSLAKDIEECRQALRVALSKEERKTLLRLIDAKDYMSNIHKLESFICGFQLATNLCNELNQYQSGDCASEVTEVQSPFSMQKDEDPPL